jgi:tetratricopeptide (TPR) repeat protein
LVVHLFFDLSFAIFALVLTVMKTLSFIRHLSRALPAKCTSMAAWTVFSLLLTIQMPAFAADPSGNGAYQANPKSVELNEEGARQVRAGNFRQAEETFLKAHLADSKNLTAVFNLAGMYLNNKKIEDARKLLESYLSTYKDDAGLYARLGDVFFSSKNVKEAVRNYESALKLDPGYPGVHARLATLYSMTNRVPEAEKLMTVAVEQNPKDAQALSNLSSLQLANSKPQDAIRTAKKALQIRETPEIYVTLGTAYEDIKDIKNALNAFERARELGDKRPELAEHIDTIRKRSS